MVGTMDRSSQVEIQISKILTHTSNLLKFSAKPLVNYFVPNINKKIWFLYVCCQLFIIYGWGGANFTTKFGCDKYFNTMH
jgi:hypothetical protein